MTTPRIPSGLKPVVEGYSIGAAGGVMRTEVGGGRPRYGLDWDRGVQPFRVTLAALDALKFSIWTTFYHHTIKKGAYTFEMDLDSGYGVMAHDVNIVPDSYSAVRTGNIWTATFVVEAESAAYAMSSADAVSLLAFYEQYGYESAALLEAISIFANQHTLVLA